LQLHALKTNSLSQSPTHQPHQHHTKPQQLLQLQELLLLLLATRSQTGSSSSIGDLIRRQGKGLRGVSVPQAATPCSPSCRSNGSSRLQQQPNTALLLLLLLLLPLCALLLQQTAAPVYALCCWRQHLPPKKQAHSRVSRLQQMPAWQLMLAGRYPQASAGYQQQQQQ
jgi:hypothetical protein